MNVKQVAIASPTRATRTLRSPNALMLSMASPRPMAPPYARMATLARPVLKSAAAVAHPSNVRRTEIWQSRRWDHLDTARNVEANACLAHLLPGETQALTMLSLRIDNTPAAEAAIATPQEAAVDLADSVPLAAHVNNAVVLAVAKSALLMCATKAPTRRCT